jgi:hypothetical protein
MWHAPCRNLPGRPSKCGEDCALLWKYCKDMIVEYSPFGVNKKGTKTAQGANSPDTGKAKDPTVFEYYEMDPNRPEAEFIVHTVISPITREVETHIQQLADAGKLMRVQGALKDIMLVADLDGKGKAKIQKVVDEAASKANGAVSDANCKPEQGAGCTKGILKDTASKVKYKKLDLEMVTEDLRAAFPDLQRDGTWREMETSDVESDGERMAEEEQPKDAVFWTALERADAEDAAVERVRRDYKW